MGVPIMSEAIVAYHHIAASPEFREAERVRSKARHDEAQAMYNVRRKEAAKWQSIVEDKDTELANNRAELANKDTELARLRAQLGLK
jgi:hypothetical protein